jgi:hypothetical protein
LSTCPIPWRPSAYAADSDDEVSIACTPPCFALARSASDSYPAPHAFLFPLHFMSLCSPSTCPAGLWLCLMPFWVWLYQFASSSKPYTVSSVASLGHNLVYTTMCKILPVLLQHYILASCVVHLQHPVLTVLLKNLQLVIWISREPATQTKKVACRSL